MLKNEEKKYILPESIFADSVFAIKGTAGHEVFLCHACFKGD